MLRLKSARPASDASPSINLTPMLDAVFLILIFFLLTSIIAAKPVIKLDLPQSESSQALPIKNQVQVVIQKDGTIEIDERPVSLNELEGMLQQKMGGNTEEKLLISADKAAPFGQFIKVLDVVKRLNIDNLEILTAMPKEAQ